MGCPIETSNEWLTLVNALGRDKAMAYFHYEEGEGRDLEMDAVNRFIATHTRVVDEVKNEEDKIIKELITADKNKIVEIVDDFFSIASSRLRKIINNRNYDVLKKVLTTKEGINKYVSLESLLKDAKEALEDAEGISRRVRAIAITIVQTGQMVDLIRENVQDIVADKANAYKNISTLQYHLYSLKDWELFLNDAKKTFSGNTQIENSINTILGKIKAIETDIIDNDVAGMVSAFKPYLAPASEKYLEVFKKERDRVKILLANTKNQESKEKYQKVIDAFDKKIKEYDFNTNENIIDFLTGKRGDANFANMLFESYSDSTDPTIASFTEWLKDNLQDISAEVNATERAYESDLAEIIDKLGQDKRFNPETLGKLLTKESERVDESGKDYKVVELLNEHSGTEKFRGQEMSYKKIEQIFRNEINAIKKLIIAKTDVEANKKLLSEKYTEYRNWKAQNMFQEYTDEYYKKFDLFKDPLGQELKDEVDDIFDEIKQLQIPSTFGQEIPSADLDRIDSLFKQYIMLGSLYNADKTLKKGVEKDKALRMQEIRKLNRDLHEYVDNIQSYDKAKQKFSEGLIASGLAEGSAKYDEKMEEWLNENTRTVISQEFYKKQQSIINEINDIIGASSRDENEEFFDENGESLGSFKSNWETIKNVIYGHRDEDSQPVGSEIPENGSEEIKKATLNLQKINDRLVKSSGLSKVQHERLSDLLDKAESEEPLTSAERAELDELKKKRKAAKDKNNLLTEEEQDDLQRLFKQLRNLKSKNPTEYYVESFNALAQKYGVSIDNSNLSEGKDILESPKLKTLLKNDDFKKWFMANHILVEVYDKEEHEYVKKWERLHQWNRIVPNDPKYMETKPARKYTQRVVKEQYKTGFVDSGKLDTKGNKIGVVKLEVGKHVDNRGNWLPRPGKFLDKEYERLRTSSNSTDKQLFKLLKVHSKYLMKSQENIPDRNKLGYDVPRLRKTKTERNLEILKKMQEKPSDIPHLIWEGIKTKLSAITDFSEGEGRFQAVFTDKYGNEFTSIPIKYTGRLEAENVSLDLFRSIMKYNFSAKLNNKLIEISPIANALQRILGEPANKPLDVLKRIIGRDGSPIGSTNIRAQAVNNIVKRVFEGKEKQMELGEKFEKFSGIMKAITVVKSIMFDIPASVANIINAETQNFINSSDGYITTKNLANAHKIFASEYFTAFFNDYKANKLGQKSLQSQIFDLYGFVSSEPFSEDHVGERMSSSKIKDALALHWISNHRQWGELFVQSVNAIAYLDATMVEQTTNGVKKSISLANAYELDSNGVIKLKEGIDKVWAPDGFNFKRLKSKMDFHNKRVHGNYAKNIDKPEADTYTLFSLWFMMKRFFVSMALNRFAASNIRMTKYGLRADARFNVKVGAEKGYYIETLNIAAKQIESKLLTHGVWNGNFEKLTDEEKIALVKTIKDASFMMLGWAMLHLVFGFDPDDDDKYKKLRDGGWFHAQGVYQSARLITESQTFLNAYQYKNFIFDSPMVAKTITDWLNLVGYTINQDEYQKDSGIYEKGESKAKASLYKVTGIEKVIKTTGDEDQSVIDFMKMREKGN